MAQSILEAKNICKEFTDTVVTKVLHNIYLSINKGELVSVIGKSGCGKSTLLYILSTMDTDYSGELFLDGENMTDKSESQLAVIRNKKIGFVFQFHYLINEFNVINNIMLPALKSNIIDNEEIREKAMDRLRQMDIGKLAEKKVNQLSGGEKQRVAIARALINNPMIIMADEPTGNLDRKNAEIVYNIFREISSKENQTLLIVTHDRNFAEKSDRIIEMEDGRIITG